MPPPQEHQAPPDPITGFFQGAWSALVDNAAGLADAVVQSITDPLFINRGTQMYTSIVENGIDGTAAATWAAIAEPYTSRWESGDYAGAIGYGTVEAAIAVIGTKGTTKALAAQRALTRATGGGGGAVVRAVAGGADDWPIISGIVRDAAKGKGNFGLGSGTASQASRAGESWVGGGLALVQ